MTGPRLPELPWLPRKGSGATWPLQGHRWRRGGGSAGSRKLCDGERREGSGLRWKKADRWALLVGDRKREERI